MARKPWDPFRELESLVNQLSAFNTNHRSSAPGFSFGVPQQNMTVDVAEYDDEVEVIADLPGVAEEDIDIRVQGRELTLHVEQDSDMSEEDDDDARFVHRERRQSMAFTRTVRLPSDVNVEEAEATYTNGVLTVTIPKAGETDGHSISIE